MEDYKAQARRLGADTSGCRDIHSLLASVVSQLRCRPEAGSAALHKKCYGRIPDGCRYETTLYEYYNEMIKDTIRQIRHYHGKAYVFTFEQIWDVIKGEKEAQFRYLPDSCCFEVTM